VKSIFKKGFVLLLFAGMICGVTGCSGDDIIHGRQKELNLQSTLTMDESNINAMSAGQVLKVMVKEGDEVSEGQLLVVMNSDSLVEQRNAAAANVDKAAAAVSQAEAGKAQAQAALTQAQASLSIVKKGATSQQLEQLKLAVGTAQSNVTLTKTASDTERAALERTQALYEAGGASKIDLETAQNAVTNTAANYSIAQDNLQIAQSKLSAAIDSVTPEDIKKTQGAVEAAQASVNSAESAIEQAKAGLKAAQAGVAQFDDTISKCNLKAPVAGVVTRVNVKNGDMVSSGLPTVVVTNTANPYITCNIDETSLNEIKEGQDVKITLAATGKTTYSGKVAIINKAADFATKKATSVSGFDVLTYGVKVVFNEDQQDSLKDVLHAGMTAFVDFGA